MADNRMLLLHKPSGLAVTIAKRLGEEWYVKNHDLSEKLNLLFLDCLKSGGKLDDFTLAMEDTREATSAFSDWQYTDDIDGTIKVLKVNLNGH